MYVKNKRLRIGIDIVIILVAGVFLFFGIKDMVAKIESTKVADTVLFRRDYPSVREDNRVEYIDEKKYQDIIDKKDGIILIGNPQDAWSQVIFATSIDLLVEENIEKIFYLEREEDVPQILGVREEVKTLEKKDIVDEEYDGIPIEYFSDEANLHDLKERLKALF